MNKANKTELPVTDMGMRHDSSNKLNREKVNSGLSLCFPEIGSIFAGYLATRS